ncbi:MAG: alpha/beta hydrolase [Acidobacteria bacterium]|nr:alpha/beta hydrolase [Acidobacteriota bacterium]
MTSDAVLRRNHVTFSGAGLGPVLFLHGFGTDQSAWSQQSAAIGRNHCVIRYDHVGCGRSDFSVYSPDRYNSLFAYAQDLVEVCAASGAGPVIAVGHSVSGIIAALASMLAPEFFRALILLGASPRYVNDGGYEGGFSRADVDGILEMASSDFSAWIAGFVPAMIGVEDRASERYLNDTLRQMRPDIALSFLRVMLYCDHRQDMAGIRHPTWILQTQADRAVPRSAARFLHEAIRESRYRELPTTGHLPHLTAPDLVTGALEEILSTVS